MKKTLYNIKQTCGACPSQWEAVTKKGKSVYIRYRWGHLAVDIDGVNRFSLQAGDSLDGSMSTEKMLSLTGLTDGGALPLEGAVG